MAPWRANKPRSVDLEDRFLGVLDKQAEMGTIALRRLGSRKREIESTACAYVDRAEFTGAELDGFQFGSGIISRGIRVRSSLDLSDL